MSHIRVHLAKIAFEKYFLRKVRTGSTTPVYEKLYLTGALHWAGFPSDAAPKSCSGFAAARMRDFRSFA